MPSTAPYPRADGVGISAEFSATVDGVVHHVRHHPGFIGGTFSWLAFDTDGGCTVRVRTHRNIGRGSRRFDRVEAIPAAAAEVAVEDGTIIVTLHGPANVVLLFDGDLHLPFHIFASPPCPEPTPGCRRFGPGVHRPGAITLAAGETLWLDAGAVVQASDAPGCAIRGRGILSGAETPAHQGPWPMVRFDRCPGAVVEGVTILDSYTWTLAAWHSDGWRVEGVRIINERGWSTDGVNPVNCSDVTIRDCFVRAKDDCISIKGLDPQEQPEVWTPIRDVHVRNCVFWSTNNNAVVVGSETRARVFERITIEDCDIVHSAWTCGDDAAALAIIVLDDTPVRDIAFRHIRIHHCMGPAVLVLRCNEIFGIRGLRRTGIGGIDGVSFTGVEVLGGSGRRSFIDGLAGACPIGPVAFRTCVWHGTPVVKAGDLRLECREAAQPTFA